MRGGTCRFGSCVYEDRKSYEGDWERGARHGWGKLCTEAGVYEGEWEGDVMHGAAPACIPHFLT